MDIAYSGDLATAAPPAVTTPVYTPFAPPPPAALGNQVIPGGREFERAQVSSSVVKVSGHVAVDAFDQTVSLDDRVRVVGEFRVIKVNHVVAKDGSVTREQVLAPCGDLQLVPWNPADPNDNGIVRARA